MGPVNLDKLTKVDCQESPKKNETASSNRSRDSHTDRTLTPAQARGKLEGVYHDTSSLSNEAKRDRIVAQIILQAEAKQRDEMREQDADDDGNVASDTILGNPLKFLKLGV